MPIALAAVLLVLLTAVPSAGAAASRPCPPRGAPVVAKTGAATVFINRSTGSYVGCLRPRSARRWLASPDDVYSFVAATTLSGRYAAVAFTHTPECKADCPPGVTEDGYVAVVNLRTGRRHQSAAVGVRAFQLARSGTLVYQL